MDVQRLTEIRAAVRQIQDMLSSHPNDWQSYLGSARDVLASIDVTQFMRSTSRTEEQVWLVNNLQKLAYAEPDNGSVHDIAAWCLRQWLTILESRPQNVAALQGR